MLQHYVLIVLLVCNAAVTASPTALSSTAPADSQHDAVNTTAAAPAVSQDELIAQAVNAARAPLLQIIQNQAHTIWTFLHPLQKLTATTTTITKNQYLNMTAPALLGSDHIPDLCFLRPEPGLCLGNFERWFFDKRFSKCATFVYGGCEGNANRFETIEDCQGVCNSTLIPSTTTTQAPVLLNMTKPQARDTTCELRADPGGCSARHQKWFYDSERSECRDFLYGGCDGNDNRFNSLQECTSRCQPLPIPDSSKPQARDMTCELRADPGGCSARHQKWFYDSERSECRDFLYGGCDGNDNRFNSLQECTSRCQPLPIPDSSKPQARDMTCELRADPGGCSARHQKWFYDSERSECRDFLYGGCDGNDNRFNSLQECTSRCQPLPIPDSSKPQARDMTCELRADPGGCSARHQKWFYDSERSECRDFLYGGCDGNDNRFNSLQECTSRCQPLPIPDSSKPQARDMTCELRADPGGCSARHQKWFYDSERSECRDFLYGGCDGNDNRFNSLHECESRCKSLPIPEISKPQARDKTCELRADPGGCSARLQKWFYDSERSECRDFLYGGCDGNDNRFNSLQECTSRCQPLPIPDSSKPQARDMTCELRADPGGCSARHQKWFYDSERSECRDFLYGGCDGNDNRFNSLEDCENRCEPSNTTIQVPAPANYTITQAPALASNTTTQAPGLASNATTQTPDLASNTQAPVQDPEGKCSTPSSLASCGKNLTSFYFDEASSSCKAAPIAGCGYRNAYYSEESCQRHCGAFRAMDVCRARVDPGPCRAAFPKYFFNATTATCSEFTFGGCAGGPNRFSTIDECNKICQDDSSEVTSSSTCTDDPNLADCDLIVQSELCTHVLYKEICCKSCVDAGQLFFK